MGFVVLVCDLPIYMRVDWSIVVTYVTFSMSLTVAHQAHVSEILDVFPNFRVPSVEYLS